jgi:hypothetical protein
VNRHCERSEAIHRSTKRKHGLLRRFAPRNDEKRIVVRNGLRISQLSTTMRPNNNGDPREALKKCVSGRYGFVPQ